MHDKREWTTADADLLAAQGHVPSLNFAPGVRLPAGFFARLADAALNVPGRVTLTRTTLHSDDLAAIGHLPGISSLWLDDCPVGDAEIRAFAASAPLRLNLLHLAGASISDAALPAIASLPALRDLHLSRTRITDAGLPPLATLPRLAYLWVDGTAVTDAGF
jgi:hypothetical protein